ncbi:ADP-ribosylglycohydrolase family protein [Tessaracoccus coleopterorum]|uniref:ADP-ribosylglycohydrolase family protein n=1 Tax=Tessaracoccus coleopterorum TaxID=2714950 RepID=UPI0022B24930|nr:ADP-ribosylglycohydrolase family protein [Tessaracoccus coleopterorum]
MIGLALGDALGMPTQMLTRARITELYGTLDRFHPGPRRTRSARASSRAPSPTTRSRP